MTSTILDLWNGNIAPCEHCGTHDEQSKHLFSLISRNREALSATLSESQKEILQKYLECTEEYLLRLMELAFSDGFSLGSRFAMESLSNNRFSF